MLYSLDVNVSVRDECPLSIQFSVQLSVLAFALIVDRLLLINLCTQGLDETDVTINSSLVVFIHPAFVFVEAAKVLLQIQQLILQCMVVSLSLSEFSSLSHELCNKSLFLSLRSTTATNILLHSHSNCLRWLGWLLG